MLRKLLSTTSLLVLFSLFFTGCNLLQDDPADETPGVTITPPSGKWIIAKDNPTEIIEFTSTHIKFYMYDPATKFMKTDSATYSVAADAAKLVVNMTSAQEWNFTLTETTFSYILNGTTYTYTRYTGDIPHPNWELATDNIDNGGVDANNVPTGAWKIAETPMDEIITLNSVESIITIYEYDYATDTLNKMSFPYSLNTTKDSFLVEIPDFKDGKVVMDTMAIYFKYVNDTLTIISPDEDVAGKLDTAKFVVYTAPSETDFLPADWEIKGIDDEGPIPDDAVLSPGTITNNIPGGAWISNAADDSTIIHFDGYLFKMYELEEEVEAIFVREMPYEIDGTTGQMKVPAGPGGMMVVITYSYDATTQILTVVVPTDGSRATETLQFKPYGSTEFPETWVYTAILPYDEDGGNNGDYQFFEGQWVDVSNDSIAFGLWFNEEDMKYHYVKMILTPDSMVDHTHMTFTVDESSMTLTLDDGTTVSVSPSGENLILTIGTVSHTLKRYGPTDNGYPDWWVLKDGGMTDYNVKGLWLLEGSNRTVVYDIFDHDIKVIKYNPVDSTISDMKYSYDVSMDTVYLKDETGVEMMYSFEVMGDTMVLVNAAGTLMFTRLMETLPLKEWILKEGDPYKHPINGQWLEAGTAPMEALYIQPGKIEFIKYNSADSMMYVEPTPMELKDQTMIIHTPDNLTITIPFTISNDTLSLTDPKTAETLTFVRYDGMLPLADWVIKDDHMNKYPFIGNWIVEGTEPDKIVNIMETTIEFAKYFPTMKYYDWKKWEYYFDETTMDVVIKGIDGMEISRTKPMISDDGTTLTITIMGEENTYVRYDGGIPHDSWILDSTHDSGWVDPELPPFLGEWSTTEGNRITTVGPEVITHFVINSAGEVTLTTLKYMWSETTDTLYTKDPAGTEGWVLLKSDGKTLEIVDVSGLNATLYRHEGAIPAETWNITGGADLSFTKGAHINTWAISGDTLDEIVKIGPTLITIYEYWMNSDGTSQVDTNYVDYTLNAAGNALIIHDMYAAGPEEIPFTVSGTTMTVTMKDEETGELVMDTFTEYTGSIPHPDWM